jgi:hypothetical protein
MVSSETSFVRDVSSFSRTCFELREHLNDPDEQDMGNATHGYRRDTQRSRHIDNRNALHRRSASDGEEACLLRLGSATAGFRYIQGHAQTGARELITQLTMATRNETRIKRHEFERYAITVEALRIANGSIVLGGGGGDV